MSLVEHYSWETSYTTDPKKESALPAQEIQPGSVRAGWVTRDFDISKKLVIGLNLLHSFLNHDFATPITKDM